MAVILLWSIDLGNLENSARAGADRAADVVCRCVGGSGQRHMWIHRDFTLSGCSRCVLIGSHLPAGTKPIVGQ